jgi:hypothetical protein
VGVVAGAGPVTGAPEPTLGGTGGGAGVPGAGGPTPTEMFALGADPTESLCPDTPAGQ